MITIYLLAAGLSQGVAPMPMPRLRAPMLFAAAGALPPARRAKADMAGILSDADYPPEAIRRGEQGLVGFRLEVDKQGDVTRCDVTASSGSPLLDERTCAIMASRLHFTPAADARGRPVGDVIDARLRWTLPDSTPQDPADGYAPPAPPYPPGAPPLSSSPPRMQANLASYISDADYPAEAVARREQGTVGFRLSISTAGRVEDCSITQSSGSALLDSTTCRIMQSRARFTPARDAVGAPVADWMDARIRWVLPEASGFDVAQFFREGDYPLEAMIHEEEGTVRFRIDITPEGQIGKCSIVESSGSLTLDLATCRILKNRARFNPARGADGKPRPDSITTSFTWKLVLTRAELEQAKRSAR
jgi:protein TonB